MTGFSGGKLQIMVAIAGVDGLEAAAMCSSWVDADFSKRVQDALASVMALAAVVEDSTVAAAAGQWAAGIPGIPACSRA